jgi:hypothetical protein
LEEHLPTSIAEVLRLRAIEPLLSDRSGRRCAQDDGFAGRLKTSVSECKMTKHEKVVGCRDC